MDPASKTVTMAPKTLRIPIVLAKLEFEPPVLVLSDIAEDVDRLLPIFPAGSNSRGHDAESPVHIEIIEAHVGRCVPSFGDGLVQF